MSTQAIRRLQRDLIELQRANILSIAAHPIDNNIFEWHVNIKPTDGVYSGVCFHLIMTFPESYPTNPPNIKICTPIRHPNIFNSFLCLSMLRSNTTNQCYEGWSNSYSVTSILMQLQSFLFAEKIDQDGGYQVNAQLSDSDVKTSLRVCKEFKCNKCNHSHSTPWPQITGPPEALIKVFPTDPNSSHVVVQGSSCQTTHTYWVGAYGEFGCKYGKIFYEAFINWTGDKWARNNTRGGLCRFGFGTQQAQVCGCDIESFGYGGTGMYSYGNQFHKFGQSFTKNDTITVAIDFDTQRIYFCKNGIIMDPMSQLFIPQHLQNKLLFPILSFKNSRAEFNFGAPKKPCQYLMQNGFKSLEQIVMEQEKINNNNSTDECKDEIVVDNSNVNWHSEYIIPDLWLIIFESLQVPEIFSTQFVCKTWYELINKYNVIERNDIRCYYSKAKLTQKSGKILGIGVNIIPAANGYGFVIKSQMDLLSMDAWNNGCRIGVWGETFNHFLPLVMNKFHSEMADEYIKYYLQLISKMIYNSRGKNSNCFEKSIEKSNCLKLVDTLIYMMNQIVVQFVMGNDKTDSTQVSMVMCEKTILGYCALHHLLLFLQSQNKKLVTDFANETVNMFINKSNGCDKKMTRDLGKFLIYLMLSSKYDWLDVAMIFVKEVLTRNVRWMVQKHEYAQYDTTNYVHQRLENTFAASKISRRLVMFQVWFMKNIAKETLKGYNDRLGRPKWKVRNGVVGKTKFILNSQTWWDYFNELDIIVGNYQTIDELLRFAVWNSKSKGYHRHYSNQIRQMNAPNIGVNKGMKNGNNNNSTNIGIQSVKGSGWRGRGHGGMTRMNQINNNRMSGNYNTYNNNRNRYGAIHVQNYAHQMYNPYNNNIGMNQWQMNNNMYMNGMNNGRNMNTNNNSYMNRNNNNNNYGQYNNNSYGTRYNNRR